MAWKCGGAWSLKKNTIRMPKNRLISGMNILPFPVRKQLVNRHAGDFHVERIGTKINVAIPDWLPKFANPHALKMIHVFPCCEDAFADFRRKIHHTLNAIIKTEFEMVIGQCFD